MLQSNSSFVMECFSKVQSKKSNEERLDQMEADACIWLQSFHARENNLINLESFEVICRNTVIQTMDLSSISSSRSNIEQTEKNTKYTQTKKFLAQTMQGSINYTQQCSLPKVEESSNSSIPKVEESHHLQHDYIATFPMQPDDIILEIHCYSSYCFE